MIGPDAHEVPLRHRVRAPPTPSHHRREPSPEVVASAGGRGAGTPWGSSGIPRTVGLGLGLGLVAVAGCRLGAAGPGRRRGGREASHQGRGAGTPRPGAPADGDEAHPRTPRVKDDPGSAGAADAEDAAAVNE